MKNFLEVKFSAIKENESLARVIASAFCLPLEPSLDELEDIKTAVSEAVTNCIVHAYPNGGGFVVMKMELEADRFKVSVIDNGIGIDDIEKARAPFYTTKLSEERSGMGFTVMESFMDNLEVKKNKGAGITVKMSKRIQGEKNRNVI